MNLLFTDEAWEDYLYWQAADKSVLKKINSIIKEIKRSPFDGTGKPEPLKYDLAGYWSRRLTSEHRLVYKVTEESIVIVQCRYHY